MIEAMAILAVERPRNPVAWLAAYTLEHSELGGELAIVKKYV